MSPFEVQQQLIDAAELGKTAARMSPEKARGLSRDGMNRLMAGVRQWVDLEGPGMPFQNPEWRRSIVNTPDEAQEAFSLGRVDISA